MVAFVLNISMILTSNAFFSRCHTTLSQDTHNTIVTMATASREQAQNHNNQ
jgi:hypothetical protein